MKCVVYSVKNAGNSSPVKHLSTSPEDAPTWYISDWLGRAAWVVSRESYGCIVPSVFRSKCSPKSGPTFSITPDLCFRNSVIYGQFGLHFAQMQGINTANKPTQFKYDSPLMYVNKKNQSNTTFFFSISTQQHVSAQRAIIKLSYILANMMMAYWAETCCSAYSE